MAEVFSGARVGEAGFTRRVALKRIRQECAEDPAVVALLVREARAVARLQHPNVVAVHDLGRDAEGRLFIAMDLIDGCDLATLLRAGALPAHVSAHVTASILRALAHAQEVKVVDGPPGIIHCDVTPRNILIARDGRVLLADFGLARARACVNRSLGLSGAGSIGYMSPEQARGVDLDGRSDLFSLGVVLHEMLTGERLFRGESAAEVRALSLCRKIDSPRQRRGAVPADLDRFAMRLLRRTRERRPPTARAALTELRACSLPWERGGVDLGSAVRRRVVERSPAPVVPDAAVTLTARSRPVRTGQRTASRLWSLASFGRGRFWLIGLFVCAAAAVPFALALRGSGATETAASISPVEPDHERARRTRTDSVARPAAAGPGLASGADHRDTGARSARAAPGRGERRAGRLRSGGSASGRRARSRARPRSAGVDLWNVDVGGRSPDEIDLGHR